MMTVRISTNQRIAGQPVTRVRSFLRSSNGVSHVGPRWAAQHFDVSLDEGRNVLARLEREGYLERVPIDPRDESPYWQITLRGVQLANATAASPLTRRTAERLLGEVVARMQEVNRSTFAFLVHRAYVFGSFLDATKERINDVDIALELVPRFADRDTQYAYREQRTRAALSEGRTFSNYSCELSWPRDEIFLFLRRRSRGLSIMDLEYGERNHVVFGGRHRQIFPPLPDGEYALHSGEREGQAPCGCVEAR